MNELLLSNILIEDRLRTEKDVTEDFINSIRENGLIQPIVLTPTVDGKHRLLAGERRTIALKAIGHTKVYHGATCDPSRPGYILSVELPEETKTLLEIEENVKRKPMTWQEECIGIAVYHSICSRKNHLEGMKWGYRETARLLGIANSFSNVRMAVVVAKELLEKPDSPLHKCQNFTEAWSKLIERDENANNAELARRQAAATALGLEQEEKFNAEQFLMTESLEVANPDDAHLAALRMRASGNGYLEMNDAERKALYLSNPLNPPEQFEQYRDQRIAHLRSREETVWLSRILHNTDSIAFMNHPDNAARFDHIITDIPYGIDMEMLDQTNTGMDVSSTAKEHDVEYNEKLIADFFPAAMKCTKNGAFVITWCDAMLFSWMHYLATAAGFAVQRWPFHWIKPHAGNQAASYNFTKATEIAIVCRKPGATLVNKGPINWVQTGHDDLSDAINHPFAKPFAVWKPLIEAVSIKGQLILEPFAGRGSGVISNLRLERNVVACELKTDHYNAMLENVKTMHFLPLNPNLKFL